MNRNLPQAEGYPAEKKMKTKLSKIIIIIIAFLLFGWLLLIINTKCYRIKYSNIKPGMTMIDVKSSIGIPDKIDTSINNFEIWCYDVPGIFAEQPTLFFNLNDSILIRFIWEPIDLKLEPDSIITNI